MKIFPLKFMSPLDKATNLMNIITNASKVKTEVKPKNDDVIEILGSNFTRSEFHSIYRSARKALNRDVYGE